MKHNMKQVAIVGGGGAGWLTALFIKEVWPACNITVIEDPDTPPIIAGESGNAALNKLYNFLGINISDWIVAVNAMPKLGGRLRDWNGVGTEFIHGLIPAWYNTRFNAEYPEYGLGNDFLACALATGTSTEDIFYNSKLQKLGKLPLTSAHNDDEFNVLALPMWHFDSRANAEFLKELGLKKNINLIEAKYNYSIKDINGDIKTLVLSTQQLDVDWVFDCSGFARLILEKEYNVPFISHSDYFPANNTVIWWDKESPIRNHTQLTALKYGWSWSINLRHRVGNGYIYDPNHISFEQAIDEVEQRFNTKIEPIGNLKFEPGVLKEFWKNNVIAVGLSNGFLEPLESNGLAAITEQLRLLSEYWSPVSSTTIEQQKFNTRFAKIMTDISDFLAMHYRGKRNDTEFWLDHKHNPQRISPTLREKMDMWEAGFLGINDTEVYSIENYAVVIEGLDLINKDRLRERLLAKRTSILDEFQQHYEHLKLEIDSLVKICYTTEQWKNIVYEKN